MPSGHRSAGDGDEQEREHAARPNRPGAVDEFGHRRHLQVGTHDDDADGEQRDGADLEEGREIIARREQQPHRQHRGDEAVGDDDEGERLAFEVEIGGERRRLGHRPSIDQRRQQEHAADERHFADVPRPDELIVDAHQQRDRDGAEHRERAPRAADQRLDDDEREHRKHDDADQEDADAGDRARDRAHLGVDDVAERTAVAPRREKQHRHVLDRAGKHRAGENPQRARQIAHLRGKHRTDERAGAGDGRKMVAVEHVAIGRNVIEAVVVALGGRGARRIDAERPVGDE